jgi:cell division initiation protein
MFTPIDIQNKTFKTGIGYDKKDIDFFISEVTKSYEELYKENVELNDKILVLNNSLSKYKSIEKSLQKALVLAQKAADETKESARTAAKAIEEEGRVRAEAIVSDAKNEAERLRSQIMLLLNQYDVYKAQYKQLVQTQLDILESDSFNIKLANIDNILSTATVKEEREEQVKEPSEVRIEKEEKTEPANENQPLKEVSSVSHETISPEKENDINELFSSYEETESTEEIDFEEEADYDEEDFDFLSVDDDK